jgi:hypothetical protein
LSDFTKAENSSDFTRAEGVSDFEVWDIGQVTVSNFDWLPFTPPLVIFSGPSINMLLIMHHIIFCTPCIAYYM